MTDVQTDRGGHCRLVPRSNAVGLAAGANAEEALGGAPDQMPAREDLVVVTNPGAESLEAALDELCGAYTESRLEQIAYPDTLSSRGWRMALRYAAVVVAGDRAMRRIKEIDRAYPMNGCGEDHMAGEPL